MGNLMTLIYREKKMPSPKKLYADIALQKEIYAAGYHRMLRNNDPRIRATHRPRWSILEAATQTAMSQRVRDKAEESKRKLDVKKGLQGDRLTGDVLPDFIVDKISKTAPKYKEGGLIKKTGLVVAHAGELVIKRERVAAVVKAVKAAGLKPLKK